MAEVYRGAGVTVAKIVGESRALDDVAARIESAAKVRAAGHGSLANRISTSRVRGRSGVTDRMVELEHPEAGNIEFGHLARDGKTWVPGLGVMFGAYQDVGGSK